MSPARDYESRISALERALGGNPGTFTKSDGVSLKEHIEARLAAMEKATESARVTMNERLEGMNEFRNTLKDQTATFATKEKVDMALYALSDRISALEKTQARNEGKASQTSVIFLSLIAVPGLIISVITLVNMLAG